MKRNLAILGSTGSIGTQALEVVSEHPDLFEVYALTANNQVDLLINQARKYMPEVVVIANEQKYPELKEALEDLPIKVWACLCSQALSSPSRAPLKRLLLSTAAPLCRPSSRLSCP